MPSSTHPGFITKSQSKHLHLFIFYIVIDRIIFILNFALRMLSSAPTRAFLIYVSVILGICIVVVLILIPMYIDKSKYAAKATYSRINAKYDPKNIPVLQTTREIIPNPTIPNNFIRSRPFEMTPVFTRPTIIPNNQSPVTQTFIDPNPQPAQQQQNRNEPQFEFIPVEPANNRNNIDQTPNFVSTRFNRQNQNPQQS